MSYAPTPVYHSPAPQHTPLQYSSTPPVPPPKPSGPSTPAQGPPPPPLPADQYQQHHQVSELDGNPSTFAQPHQPSIPPIPHDWLPQTLKDKSTSDLHHILQTPPLQAALLTSPQTTHPSLPASQATLQPHISANIALANSVLALESRLHQQRSQTQSRLLALRALEQQHRAKIAETEDALRAFSPQALYQRLSAGVLEQDNLVLGIEESWLEEGGVATDREVGEFLRRVKEGKKAAFLRRERKGRWDEGRVGGWR